MTPRGFSAALAAGALLAGGCSLQLHPATLTFRIDAMDCSPTAASNVCSFFAYYGNVGGHSIQVEPSTTRVIARTGQEFAPVPEAETGGSFVLQPGQQHQVSWSVTLPTKLKPARVTWHGSKVPVQFDANPIASASVPASALASVSPSVIPSLTPSPPSATPTTTAPTTAAPTTTPAPPTKTTPLVKPTTRKPTPTTTTRTTVKPTTNPPTTPPPPPPTTTTRTPVRHTTAAPTTDSTNPGGGSGGIG